MASAEREPITAVWGRAPSGRAGGQGAKPPEAEGFSDLRRRKEAANLPSSCVLGTLAGIIHLVERRKN